MRLHWLGLRDTFIQNIDVQGSVWKKSPALVEFDGVIAFVFWLVPTGGVYPLVTRMSVCPLSRTPASSAKNASSRTVSTGPVGFVVLHVVPRSAAIFCGSHAAWGPLGVPVGFDGLGMSGTVAATWGAKREAIGLFARKSASHFPDLFTVPPYFRSWENITVLIFSISVRIS